MKSVLVIALLISMISCERREGSLRKKITGTWELTNRHGVVTIAPDGSFLSRFTSRTQEWAVEAHGAEE